MHPYSRRHRFTVCVTDFAERSPLAKAATGLPVVVVHATRGFESLPSPPSHLEMNLAKNLSIASQGLNMRIKATDELIGLIRQYSYKEVFLEVGSQTTEGLAQ